MLSSDVSVGANWWCYFLKFLIFLKRHKFLEDIPVFSHSSINDSLVYDQNRDIIE